MPRIRLPLLPALVAFGDVVGTDAVGCRADLILLDKNPLDDVAHVRNARAGVMVRGRWFSQKRLQEMLEAIAMEYGQ